MKEKQKFDEIEKIYEELRNNNESRSNGGNLQKVSSKRAPFSITKRPKCSKKRAVWWKQKEISYRHRTSEWDTKRMEDFVNALQQHSYPVSIDSVKASMIQKKKLSITEFKYKFKTKPRKVYISIHDSFKKISGVYPQQSTVVSGRRPWAKEPAINYDVDSEEEYEDRNAENLEEERVEKSVDDEDTDDGDENGNFIVSDDHLSEDQDSDKNGMGYLYCFSLIVSYLQSD